MRHRKRTVALGDNLPHFLSFSKHSHGRMYADKKIPLLVHLRNAVIYEKGFILRLPPWDKTDLTQDLKAISQGGMRKSIRRTAHETYLALIAVA